MATPLGQASELLVVGMLTVGIVLALVVLTGKLLIKIMNTFGTSNDTGPLPPRGATQHTVDPDIIAVLTATVEVATQGKGSINRIDPI